MASATPQPLRANASTATNHASQAHHRHTCSTHARVSSIAVQATQAAEAGSMSTLFENAYFNEAALAAGRGSLDFGTP